MRLMTGDEMKRFQEYVQRLQRANGIVSVLSREERQDMAILLRKCQSQLQEVVNSEDSSLNAA